MTEEYYHYLTKEWWADGFTTNYDDIFESSEELLTLIFERGRQTLAESGAQRRSISDNEELDENLRTLLNAYDVECQKVLSLITDLEVSRKSIFYSVMLCSETAEPKFNSTVNMILDALVQTRIKMEAYGLSQGSLHILTRAKIKRLVNALYTISIMLVHLRRRKEPLEGPGIDMLKPLVGAEGRLDYERSASPDKSPCKCDCNCQDLTDRDLCEICELYCENLGSTTGDEADVQNRQEEFLSGVAAVSQDLDPAAATEELLDQLTQGNIVKEIFRPLPKAWISVRTKFGAHAMNFEMERAHSAIINGYLAKNPAAQAVFPVIGKTLTTKQMESVTERLADDATRHQIFAAAIELFIFSDNCIPPERIFIGRKPAEDGWEVLFNKLDKTIVEQWRVIEQNIRKSDVGFEEFASWHKEDKIHSLINWGARSDQLDLFL